MSFILSFFAERDIKALLASQTPSHLNITTAADHGSPVTAPTIINTNVNGDLTINHNSELNFFSPFFLFFYKKNK